MDSLILAVKIVIHQHSLREKCPYLELFWSVFSRIRTECGKIPTRKTPDMDTFYAVTKNMGANAKHKMKNHY